MNANEINNHLAALESNPDKELILGLADEYNQFVQKEGKVDLPNFVGRCREKGFHIPSSFDDILILLRHVELIAYIKRKQEVKDIC